VVKSKNRKLCRTSIATKGYNQAITLYLIDEVRNPSFMVPSQLNTNISRQKKKKTQLKAIPTFPRTSSPLNIPENNHKAPLRYG
jgi:hypothetical protein